jgi:type I restriction enzyme S subunit
MNLPSNTVRILEANNWVSSSQLKELKAKPLPPGAVVFAKIGEALRQNRLRQIVRDTIVDNNMMGAVPREEKVDPRFFYYALSQFDFSRIAQGTALPYLTITSLSALSLEVPALPEQRAIAHILGALDDKFELNRRMNETLEAIAQAIFKSWFVDFDPVRAKASGEAPESICRRLGLTPDLLALFPDRLVDSELGEIPEGWKIGTLGTVAEHQRRGIQPAEIAAATPYIALEHMPRRCIALSDWDMADGLESNKFQFRKGEILFGKLRPYFHKVGVAPVDGVCSTDIVVVTPKGDGWFGFVLGHVSSDAFVEHTNAGSTGTKMPRTSWNDMARFQIVIPFDAISDAFTSLVQPMVDRIVASIYEGRTLAGLRDALLPQLLSGELRLSAEGAK